MAEKKKVPEYTAKAIEKYHAKFDRIAVSLPKGSKEWIKYNTSKSCNAFFNELFQRYREEHAAADQTLPGAAQSRTEPPEEPPQLDTLPEELPPLDWSQLPDDLNDLTPEQAEIIRRRCESRKAQEEPPETIPQEEWPFK